jgi:DNA topoisomerase-3
VVPTELGVTLVRGYQLIDPELCRPQVRAHVEKQIDLVAKVRRGGAAGARP